MATFRSTRLSLAVGLTLIAMFWAGYLSVSASDDLDPARLITGWRVQVSSVQPARYVGEHVVDGDRTAAASRWISAVGDVEPWVILLRPEPVTVERIVVYSGFDAQDPGDGYIVDSYVVEFLHDGEWREAGRVEGNAAYRSVLTIAPVASEAWRIRFTVPNTLEPIGQRRARIFEIELYHDGSSAAAEQATGAPPAEWSASALAEILELIGHDLYQEEVVDAQQLDFSPADGSVATRNPAVFIWKPVDWVAHYELEVATDPDFSPENTVTFSGIPISLYTPEQPMRTATPYYWRVRGVMADGTKLAWSAVRTFQIAEDAVVLPLPSMDELKSRVPAGHPRLFVRPETLEEFRSLRNKSLYFSVIARDVRQKALQQVWMPLPTEPPHPTKNGAWDYDTWVSAWSGGRQDMSRIENMAFHYLLTGDRQTGEAVDKWLYAVAQWDPAGATSSAVNDDIAQPVLQKMSRAYTWAYDALSPQTRAAVQQSARARGSEFYNQLKKRPIESRPFGSHAASQVLILGEAAIAFLGDFPEAEEWFEYTVQVVSAIYPVWGGDDGGWSEGHRYWAMSTDKFLAYIDALKVATGLDLYQKPFFRNTGYFKLYTQPPYSKIGPFGDFADEPLHSYASDLTLYLAGLFNDPYIKWYGLQAGGYKQLTPMAYIRGSLGYADQVPIGDPSELPQARLFADIGWVAMHRNIASEAENIHFMLKSSPYGSVSHSLADQNSFTLEAFGEPLAISSGYRPWYGSAHHTGWTKQTRAHNSILIGGQGQPINDVSAKGHITHFLTGSSFDYARGDASEAYRNANEFLRHVVYVRPDLFVIFDELEALEPVTYDWLLHSYHEMDVSEDGLNVIVPAKKASLHVRFFEPQSLVARQTDQFAVPLDHEMDKPVQWHLTLTTVTPAQRQHFLAVLLPRKANDPRPMPETEQIPAQGGLGLRIAESERVTTLVFRQDLGAAAVRAGVLETDGRLAGVKTIENGATLGLFLTDGASLRFDGLELVAATELVDIEVTYDPAGGVSGMASVLSPASVLVFVPGEVTDLEVNGATFELETVERDGVRYAKLQFERAGSYTFAIR